MATIDQIRKQYDKLTDRERFALLTAARERDDDNEVNELLKSAPRKRWSMPTTYGLTEGFNFLGMWYMMQLQSDLMMMFWVLNDNNKVFDTFNITFEGRKIVTCADELGMQIARRVLAYQAAWVELCDEYKIDPEKQLEPYPRYEIMMLLILMLDRVAGKLGEKAQPSHEEIPKALEDMRAVIEHFVKDWN